MIISSSSRAKRSAFPLYSHYYSCFENHTATLNSGIEYVHSAWWMVFGEDAFGNVVVQVDVAAVSSISGSPTHAKTGPLSTVSLFCRDPCCRSLFTGFIESHSAAQLMLFTFAILLS